MTEALDSWLRALMEDKHEIFRAARDANRADDLLLALEMHNSLDQTHALFKEVHGSIAHQPIRHSTQILHSIAESAKPVEMEL